MTGAVLWLVIRSFFRVRAFTRTVSAIATGVAGFALLVALAPPLPDGGAWRDWLIHFLSG
jgi:hypothetical protein